LANWKNFQFRSATPFFGDLASQNPPEARCKSVSLVLPYKALIFAIHRGGLTAEVANEFDRVLQRSQHAKPLGCVGVGGELSRKLFCGMHKDLHKSYSVFASQAAA